MICFIRVIRSQQLAKTNTLLESEVDLKVERGDSVDRPLENLYREQIEGVMRKW